MLLDVLFVPKIKFNLLSVSKLIRDSNVTLTFTDKGCSVQDPTRQTSLLLGELDERLFQLKGEQHGVSASVRTDKNIILLWHKRFGHVPFAKLSDTVLF